MIVFPAVKVSLAMLGRPSDGARLQRRESANFCGGTAAALLKYFN
jgi:hypothetical protein